MYFIERHIYFRKNVRSIGKMYVYTPLRQVVYFISRCKVKCSVTWHCNARDDLVLSVSVIITSSSMFRVAPLWKIFRKSSRCLLAELLTVWRQTALPGDCPLQRWTNIRQTPFRTCSVLSGDVQILEFVERTVVWECPAVTGRCSLHRGQLLIWRLLCSHVRVCTGLHLWIAKWFDVFLADCLATKVLILKVQSNLMNMERAVSPSVSVSACEPHWRWPSWRLKEERVQIWQAASQQSISVSGVSVKTHFDERMNIRPRLDQAGNLVMISVRWISDVCCSLSFTSEQFSFSFFRTSVIQRVICDVAWATRACYKIIIIRRTKDIPFYSIYLIEMILCVVAMVKSHRKTEHKSWNVLNIDTLTRLHYCTMCYLYTDVLSEILMTVLINYFT